MSLPEMIHFWSYWGNNFWALSLEKILSAVGIELVVIISD